MGRLTWTEAALADVRRIRAYIALERPLAAERLANRLISAGQALATHPARGRATVSGWRELTVVPPYLIRYRIKSDDDIVILEVRHGARLPD